MPLGDVSREDPPVALFSDRLPRPGRCRFLDRLSLACVETVLSGAVAGRLAPAYACRATPEVVACVENEFTRVPLPFYPAWSEPMGPRVRWFSTAGVLLRLEPGAGGTELVVMGGTKADLQRAIERIPGAWPDTGPTVTRTTAGHDLVLPF
ncbi:hypothetical protein [Streptomyces clavuligerus]|uniref:hypothetical protein n=1 Tax=Streptomyces clavuligerus TaxID=1901 RepID=UPI0018D0A153|nr:hypothetical protein [Streptomyces clavuligerus]